MTRLSELKKKLAHLVGRSEFNDSLDEEIRSHLALRADDLVAGGMPRKEALAMARREFGPPTRIAEESREAWRWTWFEDLGRDLRYAARALSRDRRFALTAIVSLALGIGVNTTMFSLAASFLLSEPTMRNPEAFVNLQVGGRGQVQMREFQFLQDSGVFAALVGFDENAELNWRSGEASLRLFGIRVTDNFFAETHVPVAAGRPIQKGERNVVVVSHRFWKSQLQGDASALGRLMILDGEPHTVVGILPANHRTLIGLGFAPELYVPVRSEAARISLYGRMHAGAPMEELRRRLTSVCSQMDQVYPNPDTAWAKNIQITPVVGLTRFMGKRSMRTFVQFFAMLMVVVGLLLMIACTNVASLLLARAAARTRELGIRLSIGATRGRLVRQLLAESLFLSGVGASAGLALNLALTNALNGLLLPLPVPIRLAIHPDWRLLAYGAAIAVGSAVIAGLLPALTSTRSTNASLKQEEHQVGSSAKLRKTLVAAQLAVSVVVLVTAVLFVRNLMRSTSMDPGFDLSNTTWAHMRLVPERYPTPARTFTLANDVLDRVRAIPGVEAASFTNVVPLNDGSNNNGAVSSDLGSKPVWTRYQTFVVSEDYFKTMGIALLSGRDFTPSDRRGGPRVVIFNESLARMVFGSVPAVGHTIRFDGTETFAVIGVVANSKYVTLGEEDTPAIYEPFLENNAKRANLSFVVRTSGPPSALSRALNRELLAADPIAAVEVKPMQQAMGFALLPSRAGAGLLGTVALLGLTLAAIGLFGVLSYSVSRRVREIGLRVALGASPRDILRLVAGEGAWILGCGLAVGMLASIFLTKPLTMFLVAGLNPLDPLTYLTVASVLILVGCLATIKPAIRALRADPAVALRLE